MQRGVWLLRGRYSRALCFFLLFIFQDPLSLLGWVHFSGAKHSRLPYACVISWSATNLCMNLPLVDGWMDGGWKDIGARETGMDE